MRILVYGMNYDPEWIGIAKYTTDWVDWLVSQGNEVHVITAPPYYPEWRIAFPYQAYTYKKEQKNGVKIWRCPLYVPTSLTGMRRIIHLVSFAMSSFPILLWQMLTWRPQWIWMVIPTFMCVPGAVVLSKICHIRIWLHVQDLEIDAAFSLGILKNNMLKKILTYIERFFWQKCFYISSISHKMLETIAQKNIPGKRLIYFPNWTNSAKIHAQFHQFHLPTLQQKFGIPQDSKVILYSGNMNAKQGLDIAIVSAILLQEHKDIMFIFSGNGPELSNLQKQAKGLSNVRFLPLQPPSTFYELLCLAYIHILPQKICIQDLVFPSKLLDILCVGGMVIATTEKTTELGQIINTVGGILCEPTPQSLANAILQVNITEFSPNLIRQYAIQNFDRSIVLERIWKIMENEYV